MHSNDENLFDGSEIETEHQLNHISDIKKRSEIQQLLEKYSGIFIESDKQLTESNIYQAHIDTGDALPVKGHYYRTPMKLKGEVSKQIDDMLSAGIISPSNSQWIAPIVLVKKKNGSYRMAIDYRRLNAVTKAFNFAMPQIHDIFAKLGGKKIFSVLDLKSGFYQISLSQDSRPKTGFACFKGCYHFNRVPFGVLNGTAYFNKAINIALGDAIENYAMAYIDDIIIYSNTWQEHMVHLQNVFKKLEAANLKLKKGKCTFASPKISFLGHVITENKLSIEEDKIKAIKEASPPTNVKEVRAFLGMAGFLRTFVKDFAKIATPLTNLTSKKVKFTWTDIHQDAFQEIKDKLTSKPVLALPQENNGQFKIYTDASIGAIGGVLMQTQNGEDKVIAYLSQKLSKSQTRWPTIQRELFAIMVALKKLEFYILGNKIDIFTDHKPLLGLLHSKPTNHVIERWLSNLSRYNFTLHYIKGSENLSADYLSRINPQNSNVSSGNATTQTDKFSDHSHKKTQTYDKEFPSVKQNVNLIDSAKHPERADKHHPSEQYDEIPETLQISNISLENILKEQLEDKFYAQIRAKIEKGDPKVNDFVLIDDLLYHIAPRSKHSPFSLKQLCISEKHEDILMNYCHEFSHAGITNTLDTYKKRFYSAKSNSKCVKVVQNCTPCKLRKLKKLESPLSENLTPQFPWQMVSMDIFGPLPLSPKGNKYILLITDLFSNYPEGVSIPDKSAETVADVLITKFICRFGVPQLWLSDNGGEFSNHVKDLLSRSLAIKQVFTSSYHPRSNGQCERINSSLKSFLAKYSYANQSHWENALPYFLMAFRNIPNSRTGFSPHFLITGQEMRLPIDVILSPNSTY